MDRAERRRRTRVVKKKAGENWRQLSWPWATRGAKMGISDIARWYNRAERVRVREMLAKGEEPEPYRARGRAVWDLW